MPVEPWKETWQLPVAESEHVAELSVPPVVPALSVKVTVPVGILDALVVSLTVAVQVDDWPILAELGEQETVVEVASTPTVIEAETVEVLVL